MTRPARTRGVYAKLDLSTPRESEVTIDRAAELFVVRHVGRRRRFSLPLAVVSQMVCERVVRAELVEKRREREAARRARRAGR